MGAWVHLILHKPFMFVHFLLLEFQIWAIAASLSRGNVQELFFCRGGLQESLKSYLQVFDLIDLVRVFRLVAFPRLTWKQ